MAEKRRYPPSLKRYKENNPTISIVLTKEMKEAIDEFRGERTYGRAVKDLILESKEVLRGRTYEVGKTEGIEIGYEKGRSDFEVRLVCKHCGKVVTVDPSNRMSMRIINKELGSFSFPHEDCTNPGNRG